MAITADMTLVEFKAHLVAEAPSMGDSPPADGTDGLTAATASFDASTVLHTAELARVQALIDA